MNKLDTIRQKIEADRQQDEQRTQDLEKLRQQIAAMDEKIDEAINNEQPGVAEKLLNEQSALKNRLAINTRIYTHKTAPDAYSKELAEICADYAAATQPKVDKITAEMEKAHKAYLDKKIELLKILSEASEFREECGSLAGIGPLYFNPRFDAFPPIERNHHDLDITYMEKVYIDSRCPDFHVMMENINAYTIFKD